MSQYIDKDALVAEIKKRRDAALMRQQNLEAIGQETVLNEMIANELNKIISLIDTLEVKEVDLEKEVQNVIHNHFFDLNGIAIAGTSLYATVDDMVYIAKHFFELGLKVKQTEDIKIGETQIYLEDDGGEPPYYGKQWFDLSCTEYEIPEDKFKDGDEVELIIRRKQKGE